MTDLISWLDRTYALGASMDCVLLRRYTNDVYLVKSAGHRYVLKIYGSNWRTGSEIAYETALLDHLAGKGARVANAVGGQDGRKIYEIAMPDGMHYAVLFDYAAGEKPQPPFSLELYYAFGQAIARMHVLSGDFVTQEERRPLDLVTLIDMPLNLVVPRIEKADDRISLQSIAEQIKSKLTELHTSGLDWGPIHGDATLDNLHVTEDGSIVLYDFDSGGPGWRASDLQGWAKNREEFAEKWQAFLNGYSSIRERRAPDLEAAPYLAVAWEIWGLQVELERRIIKQGKDQTEAYLARQIAAIKETFLRSDR